MEDKVERDSGFTRCSEVWLDFQAAEQKPSLFHGWDMCHEALVLTPAIPFMVTLPLNENWMTSLDTFKSR